MRQFVVFILVLVLFGQNLTAQAIESFLTISKDSVLIGDWVKIDLSLKRGESDVVLWPVFTDAIEIDSARKLEILDQSAFDTTTVEGVVTEHKQLTITSFDTGYFVIPPFDFKVVKDDGAFQMVQTSPVLLSVYTLPVDTTLAIKPEKKPLDTPFQLAEIKNELIIAGVILLLLIGVVVFLIYRQPKEKAQASEKPKPIIPPHVLASQKLDELEAKLLWQSDQEKAYHSELSEIVREYLELRFHILALESTTPEIISDLKKLAVSNELIIKLKEMMELSDFVKFAKFKPLAEDHVRAMTISREVIRITANNEVDTNKATNENRGDE